ncbi:13206_t:CDS:2 [Entrophospora sp. SA101]|nr:13206_t:CDS:2 [Entrophospora sp. SA101]CAJ0907992.1 21007_t:CDS:2 [Entrophospora sp. SA101]CAJ0913600.1 8142_t:CDS:2 [Entrophospora sp. SA101]
MALSLNKYRLLPPKNLPTLHKTFDLGHPDFYPTLLDKPEDQMTEENVKKGYAYTPIFEDETGSFKKEFKNVKSKENTFKPLKTEWMPHDNKEKWLRDLANNVPLKKLSKIIPNTMDGMNLLEDIVKYKVPLARATWLTKIVLINSFPKAHKSDHPVDYTKVFNDFLLVQANDYDSERWRYCQIFFRWILDAFDAPEFSQTSMWLLLIQQFMDEYQKSRTLMRLLIELLLKKLNYVKYFFHVCEN